MRKERPDKDDGRRLAESRRWFLQRATGVAAVSVAALATAPGARARDAGMSRLPQRPPGSVPVDEAAVDCCAGESAVPLLAAALQQGAYVGLASSTTGPRLFALTTEGRQRVSLGSPIEVTLPPEFVVSSLGLIRGRLALGGGLPFLADSYEVDDEMSDEVRAVMEVIPEGMPTSGRRRIDVMGVRPAVFLLDPPLVEPLVLPAMPPRMFGVVAAIAETASGGVVLSIEHSDTQNESYYAAAVDILEEASAGAWRLRASVRGLGESGPNPIAMDGDDVAIGLNTPQGAKLISARSAPASVAGVPSVASRIMALVPGAAGLTALTADRGGARRWSVVPGGAEAVASARANWIDRGALGLDGEAIVGAMAVAGGFGQSILLGRRSARLVDDVSLVAAGARGGDDHVL